MKKLNLWLFMSLFVAALTLSACGDDDTNNPPKDETLKVTAENLKGTWDATIEHDMAQGYYQRRRILFDGQNYTSWHTHLTAATINDADQSVKTVGNKEQGTWEYKDRMLILTPSKQWSSYYLTGDYMTGTYYTVILNYNPETMESTEWYETPDVILQSGIESDLSDGINGNEFYISAWPVVSLTKTELSLKINMDVFKLIKQ